MSWPRVVLSHVCEMVTDGTHASPVRVAMGVPVLSAQNVKGNELNPSTLRFTTQDELILFQRRVKPKAGDVLLTIVGTIGRSAVLTTDFDFVLQRSVAILRTHSHKVNSDYLKLALDSGDFQRQLLSATNSSAQAGVYLGKLSKLTIPLPPLPEQRRIASILDQAGAIRAKRREALESIDKIADSIFFAFFGDITSNSMQFEELLLGDVGGLDRGVSRVRPRNRPDLLGGVHPLIQTGDVSSSGGYVRHFSQTYSDIGLAQSKMWPVGTLAITIAANIAHTGILTFPACFPDSVVGFTSNPAITEVEYVRYWLRSLRATLERQAPASAQKNINLAILRNLRIPVPRLSVQRLFAEILREIEAIR